MNLLRMKKEKRRFVKYVTLRNFFTTFWIEKGLRKASFLRYSLEKANPLHGSALVVHRRVDV